MKSLKKLLFLGLISLFFADNAWAAQTQPELTPKQKKEYIAKVSYEVLMKKINANTDGNRLKDICTRATTYLLDEKLSEKALKLLKELIDAAIITKDKCMKRTINAAQNALKNEALKKTGLSLFYYLIHEKLITKEKGLQQTFAAAEAALNGSTNLQQYALEFFDMLIDQKLISTDQGLTQAINVAKALMNNETLQQQSLNLFYKLIDKEVITKEHGFQEALTAAKFIMESRIAWKNWPGKRAYDYNAEEKPLYLFEPLIKKGLITQEHGLKEVLEIANAKDKDYDLQNKIFQLFSLLINKNLISKDHGLNEAIDTIKIAIQNKNAYEYNIALMSEQLLEKNLISKDQGLEIVKLGMQNKETIPYALNTLSKLVEKGLISEEPDITYAISTAHAEFEKKVNQDWALFLYAKLAEKNLIKKESDITAVINAANIKSQKKYGAIERSLSILTKLLENKLITNKSQIDTIIDAASTIAEDESQIGPTSYNPAQTTPHASIDLLEKLVENDLLSKDKSPDIAKILKIIKSFLHIFNFNKNYNHESHVLSIFQNLVEKKLIEKNTDIQYIINSLPISTLNALLKQNLIYKTQDLEILLDRINCATTDEETIQLLEAFLANTNFNLNEIWQKLYKIAEKNESIKLLIFEKISDSIFNYSLNHFYTDFITVAKKTCHKPETLDKALSIFKNIVYHPNYITMGGKKLTFFEDKKTIIAACSDGIKNAKTKETALEILIKLYNFGGDKEIQTLIEQAEKDQPQEPLTTNLSALKESLTKLKVKLTSLSQALLSLQKKLTIPIL